MAGETRTVSATTVAAAVNTAPVLTVTAVNVTSVYGDYPVTYTLKVDGLKAGADVSAVTKLFKITGPDPASDSGNYPIDVSGATPAGYGGIQFVRGWHLITPAPLQVRIADVTTTYGQQPKFETKFYGLRNGDTAPTGINAPVAVEVPSVGYEPIAIDASTDAGTYRVDVHFDDRNYREIAVGATWTVNKAPLLVGVDSPAMVWGDKVPAIRTTAIGLVNGETVAALTPIVVKWPTAARPSAGSYPLVPSGGVSPNYATTYVSGTLTVAKRPVWVSVDDKTKVYGSPNPTFTTTVTGMPTGMTLPVSVQAPRPDLAPGKYPLTPVPPITGNIEFKELRAGTLTIAPASLTITPADQTIASGSLPGDLGWRSSGWVYDHTDARLTIKPTCSAVIGGTAVSAATKPGVYQDAIRCSGAVVPIGYTVTYATADLTVNPLVTLRATGLPTSIVPKATVDGAEVSLPRTGVEVAFGSEHSYSFPGVLTGSNGRLYITTAPAFSGSVSDNIAATASYSTMGQLISNAVTAGQVNPATGRALMQTWSEAEFGVAHDYLVRAGLQGVRRAGAGDRDTAARTRGRADRAGPRSRRLDLRGHGG